MCFDEEDVDSNLETVAAKDIKVDYNSVQSEGSDELSDNSV